MKIHYFIATLLFFPGKKHCLQNIFSLSCVWHCQVYVSQLCFRYWYCQACEFPLHFTLLVYGSFKPKHKNFSKLFFPRWKSLSYCPHLQMHPFSFEPVTKWSWFLDWSFQTRLPFSHVALIQFSSGNTVALFQAMSWCLGNNSSMFHISDWASHELHPHINPTGISGPCAHLRVGAEVFLLFGLVWVRPGFARRSLVRLLW